VPRRRPVLATSLLAISAAVLAACGQPAPEVQTSALTAQLPGQPSQAVLPSLTATTPAATPASKAKPRPAPKPKPPSAPRRTAPVVVLDPGHNGGNSDHPGQVDAEVPAGNGQTKACNTTGTESNDGYAEHAFTFDVAMRAQAILAARHVTAVLTRSDDHGVGPCVNQRAAVGNSRKAAAVVAIHADGHYGGHGFHVIEAAPAPAGAAMAAQSHRLAVAVHDVFAAESGFLPADYIGLHGYARRADLAGLNLSLRPSIFLECGNMRNAADAARMETAAGRQRIAQAIADGILSYLNS
jgi:N-acetylmuramoyl-L-alanine amidase